MESPQKKKKLFYTRLKSINNLFAVVIDKKSHKYFYVIVHQSISYRILHLDITFEIK